MTPIGKQDSTGAECGPTKPPVSQYLTTNGDGTGSKEMAVNGLITPVEFYIQPSPDEIYRIKTLVFKIRDDDGFEVNKWGGIEPLANGVLISIFKETQEIQISPKLYVIDDLFAWDRLADIASTPPGLATTLFVAKIEFSNFGQDIRLKGINSDKLRVLIQDNLINIDSQTCMATGYIENKGKY